MHEHVVEHPARAPRAGCSLTRIVASAGRARRPAGAHRPRPAHRRRARPARRRGRSGRGGRGQARRRGQRGRRRPPGGPGGGGPSARSRRWSISSTQCRSCARDIVAGMLTTTVEPSRWASTVRRRRALRRTSTSGRDSAIGVASVEGGIRTALRCVEPGVLPAPVLVPVPALRPPRPARVCATRPCTARPTSCSSAPTRPPAPGPRRPDAAARADGRRPRRHPRRVARVLAEAVAAGAAPGRRRRRCSHACTPGPARRGAAARGAWPSAGSWCTAAGGSRCRVACLLAAAGRRAGARRGRRHGDARRRRHRPARRRRRAPARCAAADAVARAAGGAVPPGDGPGAPLARGPRRPRRPRRRRASRPGGGVAARRRGAGPPAGRASSTALGHGGTARRARGARPACGARTSPAPTPTPPGPALAAELAGRRDPVAVAPAAAIAALAAAQALVASRGRRPRGARRDARPRPPPAPTARDPPDGIRTAAATPWARPAGPARGGGAITSVVPYQVTATAAAGGGRCRLT